MTKQDVIHFFHNLPGTEPEQFNKALELYRKSQNHNTGLVRQYNATGYTKNSLPNLLYDLQQLQGIKDIEKVPPVKKATLQNSKEVVIEAFKNALMDAEENSGLYCLKLHAEYPDFIVPEEGSEALRNFVTENEKKAGDAINQLFVNNPDFNLEAEIQSEDLITVLSEEIKSTSFPEAIQAELSQLASKPAADNITDESKSEDPVKFREQYPFLNDSDCPKELKILVADKITAYHAYRAAHDKLQKIEAGDIEASEEEKTALAAEAVAQFEKGEKIKAEFDYYLEKKEVLGEDPIFAKLKLEREVEAMSKEECFKFVKSAPPYISKKKTAIKKAASDDKKAALQADIDARNEKLDLVNAKLGINGK